MEGVELKIFIKSLFVTLVKSMLRTNDKIELKTI